MIIGEIIFKLDVVDEGTEILNINMQLIRGALCATTIIFYPYLFSYAQ